MEPQAPPTTLQCFADTLGQGRKRLFPGLGSAQLGSNAHTPLSMRRAKDKDVAVYKLRFLVGYK